MRAFAWFLALMALALAAIAVFSYPAWMLLHPYFDFPFHRVGERIGMVALLVGFLLVARRLRLADRVSLGYGLARRAFLREMSLALILGVASMLAVVGLMSALGLLEWTPAARLSGTDLLRLGALRVVSGFADDAQRTQAQQIRADRNSTRLNSSHQIISYAVFCLKKKKTNSSTYHTARVPHTISQ